MTIATDLERYMLGLINADRVALGLQPLQLEWNLNTSADLHSQWMLAADTFSHTGANGSTDFERMQATGVDFSGNFWSSENLAAVVVQGADSYYDEVDQLHLELMASPPHRANLLHPDLEYVGIGLGFGALTFGDGRSYQAVIVTQNFITTEGNPDLDTAGSNAANRIVGALGDDHLDGRGGTDVVLGVDGRDTLLGEAGLDVLLGEDRGLYGTEISDQVFRLYNAVFGRNPDMAGHQNWTLSLASEALVLDTVVSAFVASREFQATYGAVTDEQFVTLLYNNVLERDPDTAGFTFWMQWLSGGASREEVVTRFAESREFRANTADAMKAFMQGFGPDDVLEPGAGDSMISGGTGSDVFVFGPADDGMHVVSDLEPWDVLDLGGFGYADAAAALARVTQTGADAVFADQGVTVVFLDTTAASLTEDMILT